MQAVMGTLVKRFLGHQIGLQPEAIYHCAVMPCYDKKLEGSREDFCIPGNAHCNQSINHFTFSVFRIHQGSHQIVTGETTDSKLSIFKAFDNRAPKKLLE